VSAREKKRTRTAAPAPRKVTRRPIPGAVLWICLALATTTAVVYAPVRLHDFVDLDDGMYVSENPYVSRGLTVDGIMWALTTDHAANWHPLTWVSHMADVQLYGLSPGGHHLTNLLLHIANSLLLFGFFYRTTGATGRSAFVAAIFALHPLHVESVAWVAERKDVLSTLFWMLTLWAYTGYVRRPRANRYLLLLVCFALGLMAKPMLVTLPFVLLLLDVWPLRRATMSNVAAALRLARGTETGDPGNDRVVVARLVREKVPLLVLAAAESVVTFLVQRSGTAFASLDKIPVHFRVANAAVSYVAYIGKALWPTRLAVLYPYPRSLPAWWVLGSVVMLLGLTVLVIRAGRRYAYLPVGWFWYWGTLIPVIGLVQVGSQSMADRYMYVPLVGLLIMTAWGATELAAARSWSKVLLPTVAGTVLLACAIVSREQLQHWHDTVTLWEHTLEVTTANPFAHNNLGVALENKGKFKEAAAHYDAAARITSVYYQQSEAVAINLANAFLARGELSEAINGYSKALRINQTAADAHNGLGSALGQQGKLDEAISAFMEAVRLEPDDPKFRFNLAQVLAKKGRVAEAVEHLKRAVLLDPGNVRARRELEALRTR
jgi:tetratricopeptide (TPR) repeat protein